MQLLNPNCCELAMSFWEFLRENEVSVLRQLSLFRFRNSFNQSSSDSGLTSINAIHLFGVSFIKACCTPIAGSTSVKEFSNTDEQDDSWLLRLVDGFKSPSGSPQSWLPVVLENLEGCSDDS